MSRTLGLSAMGLFVAAGAAAPTLATPTVSTPLTGQTVVNTGPATVPLGGKFADPGVTVVRFRFVPGPGFTQAPVPNPGPLPDIGTVDVALFNARRPLTTANFLNYVDRPASAANSIQNTVIHRSAWTQFPIPNTTPQQFSPSTPFVLQGGGFKQPTADNSAGAAVVADPPVQNEYNAAEVPLLSNVRGTVAMAKLGGNPNSATSQYFFNMDDRNGPLAGGPALDTQNGGFTVFGRVIGSGMTVLDTIAHYTFYNLDGGGTFASVPLQNVFAWQTAVLRHNWVNVLSITREPTVDPLAYSATSDHPEILAAAVNGTSLTLTPVAGKAGSVLVTVTATSADLTSVSTSFRVRVKSACGVADVASLGGAANPDNHVTADDIIAFLDAFFGRNLVVADIASLGGALMPDGQLSADDIIAFLGGFFEASCP